MILLNELVSNKLYNFLLNEAKSPDEVLNILSKKYEGKVAPKIISQIMDFDPTKKYSYTQWAINVLLTNNPNDNIDFSALRNLFKYAQENHDFQLQTFNTLNDAIEGMNLFKGKSEYEIVYEDEDWIIYVPKSYQAERYIVHHLYNGATWCTASSNGEHHFDNYTSGNYNLYILANKETNEIYQYSPCTGEFHDRSNTQVDYPAQVVGGKVYDWFEDNGMDIEEGSFPGPDDIYEGGSYGLKCVNDLYAKYVICDEHGHELNDRIFWQATGIYEYEGTLCVTTNEDRKENWYIIERNNYKCIAYFDNDFDEPFFWGEGSVYGIGQNTFYHVSLTDGTIYAEIDDIEEFQRVENSGYVMLKNTDGEYTIFDPWNNIQCTYQDKNYGECLVTWYYEPDYDSASGFFIGENEDGYEVSFNPKTNEYHIDGDEEEEENVEVNAMSESIRKKFNIILEKLNKNYNSDKNID